MKIRKITRIGLFFLVCCMGFFSETSAGIFAEKEAGTKLQQYSLQSENKVVANTYQYSPQSESQTVTTVAEDIAEAYREYQQTFEKLKTAEDIQKAGYKLLEEQQFFIGLGTFGKQDVCFLPAMDQRYHRLAVFILDKDRQILYKTNELENNSICRGQQPLGIEGVFYRDYRISDKMNRFGMNKNINCIASFVRDGNSIEYLYTAVTLEELMENGFKVEEEQCYFRTFEKLGRLQVVPGTAKLVGNNIFMIYLADEQGNIVWSFQPMEDYDSLYALKGITGRDVDGDGLKDLVVLAEYSFEGASGEYLQELSCSVYYQRTDGFVKDEEFQDFYTCGEGETLEGLVKKIREYWGWMT